MKAEIVTPFDSLHRVHTYFKGSPFSPCDKRILYTRFADPRQGGHVCTLDLESRVEKVIGETTHSYEFIGHGMYSHGARTFFCDSGRKVVYHFDPETVVCIDLETTDEIRFPGYLNHYCGSIRDVFIEIDHDFPLEEQGKMGIYLKSIDGSSRRCLATVDQMLAAHPAGAHIHNVGISLRLGGEISPDQRRVLLFLVSKGRADRGASTLVRDYFVCNVDGSDLTFHGRIGCHVMWAPDNRHIYSFLQPYGAMVGDFRSVAERKSGEMYGLLGVYDTETMKAQILSDHKIRGACHVSPSPDGTMVALDSIRYQDQEVSILLYDTRSRTMQEVLTRKTTADSAVGKKIHPHPVFSHDSRSIVFNAYEDGVVRLCRITL